MAGRERLASTAAVIIRVIHVIFLQVSSAYDIPCNVTEDGKQTTYNVSDMVSRVQWSDCAYSWANETNYVLANNRDKVPELVLGNSVASFVTSECIGHIIYSCICGSEGKLYTAKCVVSCRGQLTQDKGEYLYWVLPIVVSCVLVLLVVCGFLFWKKKYRDCCSIV